VETTYATAAKLSLSCRGSLPSLAQRLNQSLASLPPSFIAARFSFLDMVAVANNAIGAHLLLSQV
jgi:hypothetical protein